MFTIDEDIREALAPHRVLFQGCVAILANLRATGKVPHYSAIRGIPDPRGGVRVNGEDIVVFSDRCRGPGHTETPSVRATESAVEDLASGMSLDPDKIETSLTAALRGTTGLNRATIDTLLVLWSGKKGSDPPFRSFFT